MFLFPLFCLFAFIDFYMALPADDGAIFTQSYEFMDESVGVNTKLNPISKIEEGNRPIMKKSRVIYNALVVSTAPPVSRFQMLEYVFLDVFNCFVTGLCR